MGRLWLHAMLVVGECDQAGSSTAFIPFSLDALEHALTHFREDLRPVPAIATTRLDRARSQFHPASFYRFVGKTR